MKLIAIVLLAAAALAEQTAPAPKPAESDLVKAAREAKEARRKPKKKVITNADVKKTTGKIMVVEPPPLPPGYEVVEPAADGKTTLEKHEEKLRARRAAAERVAAAEKKVADLEKELARVEQAFYEENDPNYRDEVITKRFDQTRRQLDEARQALANERDTLTAFDAPPPTH